MFHAYGFTRLCAAAIVGVGVLSSGSVMAQTLSFGHVLQEDHPYHLMAVRFKDELETRQPEMTVEIFPAGQLGNERTLIEGLQTGSVDITTVTSALTANFVPEFQALSLPFIFRNVDHLFATMDGPVGDVLADALRREGFQKLGYGYGGVRDLYSHDPITNLEDLKGQRLRTMQNPMIIAAWEELGANPQPIAWNDVYVSLQQRLVDGAEGTGVSYRSMGFDALAPNFSRVSYIFSWHNVMMAADRFDGLTEQQRASVLEAMDIAVQYERAVFLEQEQALLQDLKDRGVTIHDVTDLDSWGEIVAPVYAANADAVGGMAWIEQIQNAQ